MLLRAVNKLAILEVALVHDDYVLTGQRYEVLLAASTSIKHSILDHTLDDSLILRQMLHALIVLRLE